MTYAGIDQSINSTGICILDNGQEYFYIIKPAPKTNKEKLVESAITNFEYCIYPHDNISTYKTNSEREIAKTNNILRISNVVQQILAKHNVDYVCMEGISYGSRTSSLCDLAGLNYILRSTIGLYNLYIATPSEVKKYWTGIGNCNKSLMIEQFVESRPLFSSLPKNDDIADACAMAYLCKEKYDMSKL